MGTVDMCDAVGIGGGFLYSVRLRYDNHIKSHEDTFS